MKIINNTNNFPNMSNDELFDELKNLDESLQLASETGTGTEGVETIIVAAERELVARGLEYDQIKTRSLGGKSGDSLPSSKEIAQADNLARDFLAKIESVPEAEKNLLTSEKFADPIGLTNSESTNVIDLLSGVPNMVDGHKVFVLGSSDDYARIGVEGSEPKDVRVDDIVDDTLGDWRVSRIYADHPTADEPIAPGSDSGRKVLQITKTRSDTQDKQEALAKAKGLLLKRDPSYSGDFQIRTLEGIGYLVHQDVRSGGSIIVGNDGGILFVSSIIPIDAAIQAYKDGKRTSEESFCESPSSDGRSASLEMLIASRTQNPPTNAKKETVETDVPATTTDTALAVFNKWLEQKGMESATKASWDVNPFEEAFLIAPRERRSNWVYLVKDKGIIAFSPSSLSFDDAYKQLTGKE